MKNNYVSPFSARYASEYMSSLFSAQTRIETWRRLWVELARAESDLGLPITKEQVKALEEHITDIDFDYAAEKEKEFKHDVMAHIHAYGAVAPEAAGIIHREQFNEIPPHVEYSLTEKGRDFLPLLTSLAEWAVKDMERESLPPSCAQCLETE